MKTYSKGIIVLLLRPAVLESREVFTWWSRCQKSRLSNFFFFRIPKVQKKERPRKKLNRVNYESHKCIYSI